MKRKTLKVNASIVINQRIALHLHDLSPTVKMETLCSRFYAVISGTSGDIDMGSPGECLGLE